MIGKDNTLNSIAKQYSKEIKLKFLQFLKANYAFKKYKQNIMAQSIDKTRLGDVINVFSCPRIVVSSYKGNGEVNYYEYFTELINYAFCWKDTPQRHYYWEELNKLWKDEVLNFIQNKAHTK